MIIISNNRLSKYNLLEKWYIFNLQKLQFYQDSLIKLCIKFMLFD
jgi:hypothetical protein